MIHAWPEVPKGRSPILYTKASTKLALAVAQSGLFCLFIAFIAVLI
jgi:hypothetical protein